MLREESLQALADLLMSEEFAAVKGFLAALHGIDEAGLFLEVARQHALNEFVGSAALAGGRVREFRREFLTDVHFHGASPLFQS